MVPLVKVSKNLADSVRAVSTAEIPVKVAPSLGEPGARG